MAVVNAVCIQIINFHVKVGVIQLKLSTFLTKLKTQQARADIFPIELDTS